MRAHGRLDSSPAEFPRRTPAPRGPLRPPPPAHAGRPARRGQASVLCRHARCVRLAPDDAFADLVEPHIPGLLRLARRFMKSDDLAWDAVQESLLSLWQAPAPPAEARPWLVRTVIHRCLHLRRTRRRRGEHEARAGRAQLDAGPPDDPSRRIESARLASAVRRAILALPPDQRAVVLLRDIEGADYAMIARQVRVPVGTIRSRLHRARAALRDWLRVVAADAELGTRARAGARP